MLHYIYRRTLILGKRKKLNVKKTLHNRMKIITSNVAGVHITVQLMIISQHNHFASVIYVKLRNCHQEETIWTNK